MEIKRIASAIRKNWRRTPEERKIRRNRIGLRIADEIISDSIRDNARLSVWARSMANPDRFVDSLESLPHSLRNIVGVGYTIIVSAVLFVPMLILKLLLHLEFSVNFVFGFVRHPDRPKALTPSELIRNANAGAKLSEGGKRGGASKKRSNWIGERDKEIREYARKRMAEGREFHELPGLLAEHYKTDDGYPNSSRRYRTIIKQLKEEIRPK